MGIAKAYEQHIDPGLAFSQEDLEAFSIQGWASVRVEELSNRLLVVEKLLTMEDVAKFVWWKDVAQRLTLVVGWYCVALSLDTPLPLDLPQPRSSAGRELASRALKLDPERWIDGFGTDALVQLQYVSSLGSKGLSAGWKKGDQKLLNKLLNCITNERRLAEKFSQELSARKI